MATIPVAVGVGWAVSPLINMVISKTQTYLENKFFQKAGVEDEMKKLKTTLKTILLIMSTVENQRVVDPNHVELVQEIKDTVYDAEDVMDEFEYNLLDAKSSEAQKEVIIQVLSSSICDFWSLVSRDRFKERVKAITERLEQTKKSAEILRLNMNFNSDMQFHEQEHWALTSSLVSERIVGRDWECEYLMKLLMQQTDGPHTIIPIMGQSGIGKTTLAQMVFNDERLVDHFDHKMWFTVSGNFDMLGLTKEMVKFVCGNLSTVDASFDKLQRKLKMELAFKRILVIFDDVWYDRVDNRYTYEQKWLKLLAPLKKSDDRSKIVITARERIVGDILGSRVSISLGELSDKDSWSLFELYAFSSENKFKYRDLEPVGREIVKKLQNATLAIKSVGALLRCTSDIREWRKVLIEISTGTDDVMDILLRSYQHLPNPVQRCFAYCSLFPKGYHLKPNRLIYMWIAHGLIVPDKTRSLEDVAKSYFNELILRSFIQKITNGDKHYYAMHDLMYDMACHVSKGDSHIFQNGDSMKNVGFVRHLSITDPQAIYTLMNSDGLEKLRTLMFLGDKLLNEEVQNKLLMKLKTVRVLDIEWEASDFVCECKHLRYLSFRMKPGISRLPHSKKLHQLSALFLRKSSVSAGLGYSYPLSLSKYSMNSLTIVDVSKRIKVQVGGLTQIHRNLRGPACLHVRKEKSYGLDQLEHMNNIKGSLEITGLENTTSWEEAINAQLRNKEHVTELSLAWEHQNDLPGQSSSSRIDSKNHELLEALSPNLTLEKLKIKGYGGAAWPSWLNSNLLSAIKSIELSHCKSIKMLPALGQLPLLQKLLIIELSAVRRLGPEFFGSGTFASLENLVISGLPCLHEWSSLY